MSQMSVAHLGVIQVFGFVYLFSVFTFHSQVYSAHLSVFSGPTINLDELVTFNCTKKGPTVSVAWLETKDVSPFEEVGKNIISMNKSMASIKDACCSFRNLNESVENKDSVVTWRWRNSSMQIITCEGADVELYCNVTGSSYPLINWRRKRNLFPGEYLLLLNVQRYDRGTYWCEATNRNGGMLKKDITLVVEFPPIIKVPIKEISSSSTQSVYTLQCMIEAYPDPSITWYKEEILLDVHSDPYYEISIQKEENCTTYTALRVIIIYNETSAKEQFGTYKCEAQNRLGRSVESLKLIEPSQHVRPVASDDNSDENKYKVSGFVLLMIPPLFVSIYIIVKLGYRSRYTEDRQQGDGARAEPFFVSR